MTNVGDVVHQSIENFKAVRMICHVPRSTVKSGNRAYFSLLITVFWLLLFHAMTNVGGRIPQSIENFDPVTPVCVALHLFLNPMRAP